MPVLINKSDTMLSTQVDCSVWSNDTPSFYSKINEDDWKMNFLDCVDEFSSELPDLNSFDTTQMDFTEIVTAPPSPKHKMRHHDCMWSGTCVDESHPSKRRGGLLTCPTVINTAESTQKVQVEMISTKYSAGKTIMTPNSIKSVVCKDIKIPAGRSLLINPRVNTNTAPTKSNSDSINTKLSIDTHKEFDAMLNSSLRPDTPLSLDDPDFKHNIDLTPRPDGNRMKFSDANSTKIIKMYREHLEETAESDVPFFSKGHKSSPSDLNDILEDITLLSDYEDLADDDIDEELDIDIDLDKYTKCLPTPSTSSSRTISHNHEFISDHSYTRPKGAYDSLGVQTPSDSEEETIDVVNMSEKNFPTNPSARDRRAIQTQFSHKIARSKQSNQRRRVSDDDSISSSTSTLSSKGSTPIKIGSQTPQRYVSAKKRKDGNNNMHDSYKKYRHGHKKQRLNHNRHQKPIDPDEQETIEKRNLHNNMERQRRIGLKNLFEELKVQIPSLKDKERAPKVNILREAAIYCTKLRRDDELHAELLKKNNRLLTRLRNMKASIAAQQRRNY